MLSNLWASPHFMFRTTLWDWLYYYHPHFIDEGIEPKKIIELSQVTKLLHLMTELINLTTVPYHIRWSRIQHHLHLYTPLSFRKAFLQKLSISLGFSFLISKIGPLMGSIIKLHVYINSMSWDLILLEETEDTYILTSYVHIYASSLVMRSAIKTNKAE